MCRSGCQRTSWTRTRRWVGRQGGVLGGGRRGAGEGGDGDGARARLWGGQLPRRKRLNTLVRAVRDWHGRAAARNDRASMDAATAPPFPNPQARKPITELKGNICVTHNFDGNAADDVSGRAHARRRCVGSWGGEGGARIAALRALG